MQNEMAIGFELNAILKLLVKYAPNTGVVGSEQNELVMTMIQLKWQKKKKK